MSCTDHTSTRPSTATSAAYLAAGNEPRRIFEDDMQWETGSLLLEITGLHMEKASIGRIYAASQMPKPWLH